MRNFNEWLVKMRPSINNYNYYVDFENVGERVFFFDIFMYMFSEEMILGNECLLSQYFKGEFDVEISEIFAVVGEEYKKENKTTYFIYFLYFLYAERWKGTQSDDTTQKVKGIIERYLR